MPNGLQCSMPGFFYHILDPASVSICDAFPRNSSKINQSSKQFEASEAEGKRCNDRCLDALNFWSPFVSFSECLQNAAWSDERKEEVGCKGCHFICVQGGHWWIVIFDSFEKRRFSWQRTCWYSARNQPCSLAHGPVFSSAAALYKQWSTWLPWADQ